VQRFGPSYVVDSQKRRDGYGGGRHPGEGQDLPMQMRLVSVTALVAISCRQAKATSWSAVRPVSSRPIRADSAIANRSSHEAVALSRSWISSVSRQAGDDAASPLASACIIDEQATADVDDQHHIRMRDDLNVA